MIVPIVVRMKKGAYKSGSHVRMSKGSKLILSCSAHSINLMSKLLSGLIMLSEINERFPLVNMAGISFVILFSVEMIHIRLYYFRIPVDNTKD